MRMQHHLLAITTVALVYLLTFPFPSTVWGEVTINSRSRQLDCSLNETKTIAAGEVRNLKAHCKYDAWREQYYYQFTWDPPNATLTPVLRYRAAILTDTDTHFCFQLSPKARMLLFNESVGFQPRREFKYQVVAQPIKRDESGSFRSELFDAPPCPTPGKLEPLQNIIVSYGANVTFECKFRETPFPAARIIWRFSRDKRTCKRKVEVRQGEGISFLMKKQILLIKNVQERHVGCYVLTAENGVGDALVEKGYLDMNPIIILNSAKKPFWEAVGPLFGLLVLVITAFFMYKYLNTPKFNTKTLLVSSANEIANDK